MLCLSSSSLALGRVLSPRRSTRFLTSWTRLRPHPHVRASHVRPLSALVIGSGPLYVLSVPFSTRLEHASVLQDATHVSNLASANTQSQPPTLRRKLRKALRLMARFLKLVVALSPMLVLYPVQRLLSSRRDDVLDDAHEQILLESDEPPSAFLGWYLNLCLYCTEWSGAAVIKLMQWAGSRPDMFGHEFCAVFSKLQDETTPHKWKHTEKAMRDAYGKDWEKKIQLHEVIGSGCIGQVYKGVGKDRFGRDQDVAVKVLHPNVQEDIDSDLDLMRLAVRFIRRIPGLQHLRWLNMEETVEEFGHLLKLQLDLRIEAANLKRFNENFVSETNVVFPELIEEYEPSRNVLVETFCEGVPILNFAKENREEKELLHRLCMVGIQAVCKMIFVDNFMHADLHPGNVFVSPSGREFIVLDVGMVNEFSEEDHRTIVGILTSFIRKEGREAGRLLIDDSNSRLSGTERANREEEYIDKIEHLTIRASGKDYFMEHLGTYISYICEAASTHHVMMNQAFVSAALAIKVQEGIALALDPSIEIWKVANPVILKSEFRRQVRDAGTMVRETLSLGSGDRETAPG